MIDITLEAISKLEELMHDHVGYAAARNAERILYDLQKQAELRGVTGTTIPLSIKVSVHAGDDGLRLTIDDVSWQVLQKVKDKDFCDVNWDPRQPNLPGLDQAPADQPKPVIDVKALPEHKSLFDRLFRGAYMEMADNCKRNLENASDALTMMIVMPGGNDHRCETYSGGVWGELEVPNTKDAIDGMDDGSYIVFGLDGLMTDTTRRKLVELGFSVDSIVFDDGEWQEWRTNNEGVFALRQKFLDTDFDRRQFAESLVGMTDVDDSLLMSQIEMYDLK